MKMDGMIFFMASRSLERGLSANFTLELQILQAVCRQANNRDPKKKERGQEEKILGDISTCFDIATVKFKFKCNLNSDLV